MAIEHDVIPIGELHKVANWQYANAAARVAATGFIASDVGKFAWQLDNNSIWILTATVPTWVRVGAPTDATYLVQTASSELSAEQVMGALATGIVKNTTTTGVQSIAAAGTDYVAPGGALGTPSSGTLTNCTADGTDQVGFRNVPINPQSTAYSTVLADGGKAVLHPVADNNPRTFTIDGAVAYPVGSAITFINMINTVTIAISTDTLTLIGAGTTGSRTLAAAGMATAVKIASGSWVINGTNLT